jgi:hypothetical protein
MNYAPVPPARGYEPPQQRAYASQDWTPPVRGYAPPQQRTYTSQEWAPPAERVSAPRTWAQNDTTAAAPRSSTSTLNWSPADYRAGLAAR